MHLDASIMAKTDASIGTSHIKRIHKSNGNPLLVFATNLVAMTAGIPQQMNHIVNCQKNAAGSTP